jgi:hypothetical protein
MPLRRDRPRKAARDYSWMGAWIAALLILAIIAWIAWKFSILDEG